MRKASTKFLTALLTITLIFSFANPILAADKDKELSNKELISLLDHDNIGIRFSATRLLGERHASEAITPLTKVLKEDKEMSVRQAAALALYEIGDLSVLPFLKERAKKDKNQTVRHVLNGVVKEMEKKYASSNQSNS